MATLQTRPLAQDKFLLVAVNLLHRGFLDCPRAEAKQRFRKLQEGARLLLSDVRMEDESTARFAVALDYSEFIGRLNFSAFRTSLEVLLSQLAAALKEGRELPVFSSEGEDGTTIFGATGATVSGERANVMVLATAPHGGSEVTVLKLMYLDPEQFRQQ